MSAAGTSADADGVPAPAYTLRFTEWVCGHHCERPGDIPIHTLGQAEAVLHAISHAITQPGYARAVLFDATRAEVASITDDDISIGMAADTKEFCDPFHWDYRPTVVVGEAALIDQIHSDELSQALDELHGVIGRWDGSQELSGLDMMTTTMSREQVEGIAAPVESHEVGRYTVFYVPPVILDAAAVVAELKEAAAAIAAEAATQ